MWPCLGVDDIGVTVMQQSIVKVNEKSFIFVSFAGRGKEAQSY